MSNIKIILVDDEPINLKLYQKMLHGNNCEIISASNGKQCLDLVVKHKPDLIILDWNMPEMDGIETLKALKGKDNSKDIPVIMISGVMTSSEDLASAMHHGAMDFIRKPFDRIELNARVDNILLLIESMRSLKKQTENLENKNLFINSLFESLPQPVMYCNVDGTLLMCNHNYSRLFQLNPDELIGKSIYRFLSGEVATHVEKDVELMRNKEPLVYESSSYAGNNTFLISKNFVVDKHQTLLGIINVLTDITILKTANDDIVNKKQSELITRSLNLVHLKEQNKNILEDINDIIPHTDKEGQERIRQILVNNKLNISENLWDELGTKFENVFNSFYKTLLFRYPDLTSNERKLCVLIRAGLSSKDIAMLTFQNAHSVDVARYRIRKKLKLSSNENFADFLLKLDEKS